MMKGESREHLIFNDLSEIKIRFIFIQKFILILPTKIGYERMNAE